MSTVQSSEYPVVKNRVDDWRKGQIGGSGEHCWPEMRLEQIEETVARQHCVCSWKHDAACFMFGFICSLLESKRS
jgi:hypothetical protein